MKTLFLFRHAKTQKAQTGQDDHSRSLVPHGEEAAVQVGKAVNDSKNMPAVILTSDARRATHTAELAQQWMHPSPPVLVVPDLYTAGAEDVIALLAGRPEDSIMVVGHNPCIEEAIEVLSGDYHRMRPGYCMMFSFDIREWEELYNRGIPVAHHLYKPITDDE